MSMNKFLMNIAVCAVSLTSVSYGSEDTSRTPEKQGSDHDLTTSSPSVDRFSVSRSDFGSRKSRAYVPFAPRLGTQEVITEGDVVQALLTAEAHITGLNASAERKEARIQEFLRNMATLLTTNPHAPVAPKSGNLLEAARKLALSMKELQAVQEKSAASTQKEAEKDRALEAEQAKTAAAKLEVAKWQKRTHLALTISGIVCALLYQNVLNNGGAWLSFLVNYWNSFQGK